MTAAQADVIREAKRATVFRVPEIPVGPNGKGGLYRMHWKKRSEYFERWQWLIKLHATIPDNPIECAVVNITQYRRRVLDEDNLYASCKPILDAMVKLGILKDDSPRHCRLVCWQFGGKEIGTTVEIQEIER